MSTHSHYFDKNKKLMYYSRQQQGGYVPIDAHIDNAEKAVKLIEECIKAGADCIITMRNGRKVVFTGGQYNFRNEHIVAGVVRDSKIDHDMVSIYFIDEVKVG